MRSHFDGKGTSVDRIWRLTDIALDVLHTNGSASPEYETAL